MRQPSFFPARGLGLVELLVGLAVGLVAAAATATLFAHQVREQRALTVETRLMQDLGAAADLIARDLRRAGYWGDAAQGVWSADAAAARANPYAAASPPAAPSGTAALVAYSRDEAENDAVDDNERFGWRLADGAIELRLGAGPWQTVTDASLLVVTELAVVPALDEIDLSALCPRPCAAGDAACPPRQQVRSATVRIAGRAAGDARVVRAVETRVRLRNDRIVGACGG